MTTPQLESTLDSEAQRLALSSSAITASESSEPSDSLKAAAEELERNLDHKNRQGSAGTAVGGAGPVFAGLDRFLTRGRKHQAEEPVSATVGGADSANRGDQHPRTYGKIPSRGRSASLGLTSVERNSPRRAGEDRRPNPEGMEGSAASDSAAQPHR